MHRVPVDSIAAVGRVHPRGPRLVMLLFLLFGKEDVLGEVPGARISPLGVEVLRLQIRHDVSCRGELLPRGREIGRACLRFGALLMYGYSWRVSGARRPPR